MFKLNKLRLITFSAVMLYGLGVTTVVADEYSFTWSANAEPIEGYKLYYKKGGVASLPFDGISANEGSSPIDIGNKTSFTLSGLDDIETYHFTLTAYSGSDESAFTQVITVSPGDEQAGRMNLAFPIILDLLLGSDSQQ